MIPLRLSVRNFMCYRDNVPTLDFESLHVACLCGENGHGKSALLDAITWALWGSARASQQHELIHQGQTFSPWGPTPSPSLSPDPLAGGCGRSPSHPASARTRRAFALGAPVLEPDCPRINGAAPPPYNAGGGVFLFLKLALMGLCP